MREKLEDLREKTDRRRLSLIELLTEPKTVFKIHLVLPCRIQDTIEDGGDVIVALEGVEDVGGEGGDQGVSHAAALPPLLLVASVPHISSLLSVMCLNDLNTNL